MINVPYTSPRTFFELIEYGHQTNLCMKLGCTTCGCMEFRSLCRDKIGKDNMAAMIQAVTDDELKKHDIDEWCGPLRVILHDLRTDVPSTCALIGAYNAFERDLIEYNCRRREISVLKDKHTQLVAVEKHKDQMRQREIKEELHKGIMESFNGMSLQGKLLTIAHDKQNLPAYYPISFIDIPEEELRKLPRRTLWFVYESFGRLKKREWRVFAKRIHSILLETKHQTKQQP